MSTISSFLQVAASDTGATFRAIGRGVITASNFMPAHNSGAQGFATLDGKRILPLQKHNEMTVYKDLSQPTPEADPEMEFEDLFPKESEISQNPTVVKDYSKPYLEDKPLPMSSKDMMEFEELSPEPLIDEEAIERIFADVMQIIAPSTPVPPAVEIKAEDTSFDPSNQVEKSFIDETQEESIPKELPLFVAPAVANSLSSEPSFATLPMATKADLLGAQSAAIQAASVAALVTSLLHGALAYGALYPREGMTPSEEMFMRSMTALMLLVSIVGTMYTAYTGKDF